MCKIQCLLIILLVNLLGALGLFAYSQNYLEIYNFEIGYISFLLVAIANFLAIKKYVQHKANLINQTDKNQKKKNKPSKIISGIELSFSWLRILAYTLLIIGLFSLMHLKAFIFWAYLLGISLSVFITILLQYVNLKKSKNSDY
ncbi:MULTISPECIES: hypothetical protein [unclassified Helicobacter]|uniref:hypothetical protein n=1 Tax=unclassified Helicobacter TaxID=2593540 RepID=UPI000CF0A9F7|nr:MULTISPECIES: hypothetical protein [unclassified Helicobacter]